MTSRGFVTDLGAFRAEGRYDELLRVPDLSAGVYDLPAGAVDPQSPHAEDEVYLVLSGRAVLEVDGVPHPVGPGSLALVAAGVPHRFTSNEEDLRAAVFFGPAEGSRRDRA